MNERAFVEDQIASIRETVGGSEALDEKPWEWHCN